ncbi:MAG: lysophospholipid acyltransferase family protein, partial [Pseudomonadota bacterium]
SLLMPAKKYPFRDSLLYFFLKRLLLKNFNSTGGGVMAHIRNLETTRPVIAFANHSNWWDGVIIFFLSRFQRRKDFYCMMEEKQMRHYPFFAWLGAFSVDLENSLRAAGTIRYTCNLLRQNRTLIWIFPQGVMGSPYEPIEPRPGIDFLAKRFPNAQMLPMVMQFGFEREQHPLAYLRIGKPYIAAENSDERIEQSLTDLLGQINADVQAREFSGYETILSTGLSMNKRWEWVKRLFTGKLQGFSREN